jgi:hypothetical protein
VKSYAIDALLRQAKITEAPSVDKAKAFIERASQCEEKRDESIGYGWDHRFEGKTIVGSSLVYQEKVIHMTIFQKPANILIQLQTKSKMGHHQGFHNR